MVYTPCFVKPGFSVQPGQGRLFLSSYRLRLLNGGFDGRFNADDRKIYRLPWGRRFIVNSLVKPQPLRPCFPAYPNPARQTGRNHSPPCPNVPGDYFKTMYNPYPISGRNLSPTVVADISALSGPCLAMAGGSRNGGSYW